MKIFQIMYWIESNHIMLYKMKMVSQSGTELSYWLTYSVTNCYARVAIRNWKETWRLHDRGTGPVDIKLSKIYLSFLKFARNFNCCILIQKWSPARPENEVRGICWSIISKLDPDLTVPTTARLTLLYLGLTSLSVLYLNL